MRLFVEFVLLGNVGVCSVVLEWLFFHFGRRRMVDPATPEDIKSSVEKGFSVVHRILFFSHLVVEKEKPFQRNVYVFYDESNGISLLQILCSQEVANIAGSWWRAKNDADFAYSQAYLVHFEWFVSGTC